MKTFVQIGTNDGNDEFNEIVKEENPDLIILVEPNEKLNEKIHQVYSGVKNYFIENSVINLNKGPCKLVYPIDHFTGIQFYDVHFSLVPMDDWGENLEEIQCEGITFSDLCEKYNINSIDYLQIDTEGFDSQIILSIDFDKINIKKIKYEKWNFTEECFTRYGDYGKELGKNGMINVEKKLKSLGYTFIDQPCDIVAFK